MVVFDKIVLHNSSATSPMFCLIVAVRHTMPHSLLPVAILMEILTIMIGQKLNVKTVVCCLLKFIAINVI